MEFRRGLFRSAVQHPDRLLSLILGGTQPGHSPPNVAWAGLFRQGGMQRFVDSAEAAMTPFPPSVHERFLTADPEALAAASLVERPSLEAYLGTIQLPT